MVTINAGTTVTHTVAHPAQGRTQQHFEASGMRIGLSYHGGDHDYEAYPAALLRRAAALGISLDTIWLAGDGRPTQIDALGELDAVLLTGGADVEPPRYGHPDEEGHCKTKPERDGVEWDLLERLRSRPLPLLAVCRGAQILNVFHGGTLITDLGTRNAVHKRENGERRVHDVHIVEGSRLHGIAEALGGLVNTSHHQAVDELAEAFRISAWSPDGVIEAFEPVRPEAQPFLLAVQWHPEGMDAGLPLADRVLDAFLQAEY